MLSVSCQAQQALNLRTQRSLVLPLQDRQPSILHGNDSTGAIRLDVDGVKFSNGIKIANVSEDKIKNNQTWPVWTDNNKARAAAIGYEYLSDATYKVPEFPEASTQSQQGGIVNPLEGIKGYDVALTRFTMGECRR